jgi:hypothetical protein
LTEATRTADLRRDFWKSATQGARFRTTPVTHCQEIRLTFYLHVGASKTASTTLQGHFFPGHPDIFFLGKEESRLNGIKRWATPEISTIGNDIDRRNLDFRLDMDTVTTALDYIRKNNHARRIVYSFEDLCEFTGPSPFEKLARFLEVFAEFRPFRIIMGVRDQLALLKSLYLTIHRAEMLRIPGERMDWYPTFDQFIDINFRYAFGALLQSFCFSIILDHYANELGSDNVFVYSFDEFQRDPTMVLRRLCRFMSIDDKATCIERTGNTRENAHHSRRRYSYLGLRRMLFGSRELGGFMLPFARSLFWRWVDAGPKFDFTPSEAATRRIREYYRSDNDALAKKYGIRL